MPCQLPFNSQPPSLEQLVLFGGNIRLHLSSWCFLVAASAVVGTVGALVAISAFIGTVSVLVAISAFIGILVLADGNVDFQIVLWSYFPAVCVQSQNGGVLVGVDFGLASLQ
jgi:hypothetical protein